MGRMCYKYRLSKSLGWRFRTIFIFWDYLSAPSEFCLVLFEARKGLFSHWAEKRC